MTRFEKITISLTVAIAGATVASAVIFYCQWQEMKGASQQTAQIIDKSSQQVEVTMRLANAAQVQAQEFKDLSIQAKRSADISDRVFYTANRPYVGPFTIRRGNVNPALPVNMLGIEITVKNYGTAPATNVTIVTQIIFDGQPVNGAPLEGMGENPGTLFPGSTYGNAIGIGNGAQLVSPGHILEVKIPIHYDGPGGKRYSYCEVERYDRSVETFVYEKACTP